MKPGFISLVCLLLCCTLMLSACDMLNLGGRRSTEVAITEETLRQGTDALVMSFYPNTPPNETYEDSTFEIAIVAKNIGATNIQNGKIVLSYDRAFIENTNEPWAIYSSPSASLGSGDSIPLEIKGKTMETPEGEESVFSKRFRAKMLESQRQNFRASFTATACYDYQTKKSVPICIDPEPFKETDKACQMKPVSLNSQGAPVAITRVSPRLIPKGMQGYELEVEIAIKNKGKGQVYKRGGTDVACGLSGQSQQKFWNIIQESDVNVRMGSDESSGQFECSPFPLELTGKEDIINCVYKSQITEKQAFTTPIIIEINYGYTHSIIATTTISRRSS